MAKSYFLALIAILLFAVVSPVSTQDTTSPLTLNAGVANYGGDYGVATGHRSGNIVVLSGLVRPATGTLMTLPANLRPAARQIFAVQTQTGTARVDVLSNGDVTVVSGGNSGWLSLNGIVFVAQ